METGPRVKVSSESPEKREMDLAIPGLVVQRFIHYTIAAPNTKLTLGTCVNYILLLKQKQMSPIPTPPLSPTPS